MREEYVNPNLPALKYGRLMENEAIAKYRSILKNQGHELVKVTRCGLFVLHDKMYIGASPDGIVSCKCHTDGLLEVKSLYSIAHTSPTSPECHLDCLSRHESGLTSLKHSHQYYSQIQAQMGVTGYKWCDFFIYTRHGHYLVRILFDDDH